MRGVMRFPEAIERDPAIEAWLREQRPELAAIARRWFDQMRKSGRGVRELMHDGCPTACVGAAAFAYVGAELHHRFGIGHPTIQIEAASGADCALESEMVV